MPPSATKKALTAFLVHGRDVRARNTVATWLQALGLETPRFEDTADGTGPLPIISDVVRRGIKEADVVVVLFTPDELAVLYEQFGRDAPGERSLSRWQARPNVLFEAGWAFGLKPKRTVFVTLGEDTTLFSDVAGYHAIRLEDPDAPARLAARLRRILRSLPRDTAALSRPHSDDLARVRFRFHDELTSLVTTLRNTEVRIRAMPPRRGRKGRPAFRKDLLALVEEVVEANPTWSWEHRKPLDLALDVKARHSDRVANIAFWWLTSAGFFHFSDIELWGDHYEDCSTITSFAPRAVSLLKWLATPQQKRAI
jgi:hypothetical protein